MKLVIGEVRQIKPNPGEQENATEWESGYCKVRIYGPEDDESKIKDEHLAFAIPVQDITSAATEKIGKSPTGLLVGSRVILAYAENDTQNRHPFILGSFARAGSSKSGKVEEGFNDVDYTNRDAPIGSLGSKHNPNTIPQLKRRKRKLDPVDAFDPSKRRYNNIPFTQDNEGYDGLQISKDELAKRYGERPTIGSVRDNNVTDVLNMIRKVDPSNISSMLPNAVPNIQKIIQIDKSTSIGGITNMLGGSIGNVLSAIAGAKNLANVIKTFGTMFNIKGANSIQSIVNKTHADIDTDPNLINLIAVINDMMCQLGGFTKANSVISAIPEEYKVALYNGLLQLLESVDYNFAVTITKKTVNKTVMPANRLPYPVISNVPDGYVEVFSYQDEDPYPGYILWENPDGGYYFALRPADKPYCGTPEEDAISFGIFLMLKEMTYLINNKKLTYALLIELLIRIFGLIEDRSHQNTFGKNVKKNNIMNFLQQLLGVLGSNINQAKTQHIAQSVLNKDKVNEALRKYSTEAAAVKKKKKHARAAVDTNSTRPNGGKNDARRKIFSPPGTPPKTPPGTMSA